MVIQQNVNKVMKARPMVQRWLHKYHAKYIQTNSIDPLYHVCFGGMALSYLVNLPEELRHLEHAKKQHARDKDTH